MFGYVTVFKPELKIKEYDIYKGIYCTLCKQLKKEYGFFSRFLLSYDAAFYAVYRMGVTEGRTQTCKSHCSFSHCKKCLEIRSDENIFKKASAVTVILSYFKLCDNISDSRFLRRIICKLVKPYFNHIIKKAKSKFPDIYSTVETYMSAQANAENEFHSIDAAADPTGNVLGYLLSDGDVNSPDFKVGYNLGRAIYFLDAFDDYLKDKKTSSFNPFKNSNNIFDDAAFAINMSVGEITEYIKSVKFYRFREIIYNVIFYGIEYNRKKIEHKLRGEKVE